MSNFFLLKLASIYGVLCYAAKKINLNCPFVMMRFIEIQFFCSETNLKLVLKNF